MLPHVLGKIYIWNPIWCHVSNIWNLRPNKSSLKLNLFQTGNKTNYFEWLLYYSFSFQTCTANCMKYMPHIYQRTSWHFKVTKLIHFDPLMVSRKEAPRKHPWVLPRKAAKMVWISVQFSFVENDGCFLGASYYVLAAAEGSTQEAQRKHPRSTQEAAMIIY